MHLQVTAQGYLPEGRAQKLNLHNKWRLFQRIGIESVF